MYENRVSPQGEALILMHPGPETRQVTALKLEVL